MPAKTRTLSEDIAYQPLSPMAEQARLEALRAYQVLDTPPEKAFDDLVSLASYICGTPTSMVTLLDSERQWFKARVGMKADSTPLEQAFCRYAMFSDTVFEIEDATQDPRFQNNPLVTADPNIRFYAGAPLLTPEGHPLGTICAIDTVPRRLDPQQREALRILAREVVAHLELRRARMQLIYEQQKLEELLRMTNDTAGSMNVGGGQSEIFVKQEHKLVRLKTVDIRYVEALGDYVNIYVGQDRYTVYSTMKELEAKLPAKEFARIHRKYIVRLDKIVAIESDAVIVEAVRGADRASGVMPVPIGNSYKANLLSRLNLI
ncbi:GAF domain-containing DNA-binding protein [Hymenobacter taeanensis]|uniref:GAF domain-containing DNA-binding protein n=1 Tax=Hymenobacter taeanensis TaxID=2735321 RepID=A0A6M6BEB2_9BACT|nr:MULTISPECIES: GAF domain-containing DNA-binding protein [Hymenobacter]QJX46282.1 GAF domain-containing DNA-binding protein [Hymenobacter taeanensis]UOQ80138.1 GAF domain-containing DNA-binding protein [Hymenobacter sp. 5414T-23]